MRIVFLFIVAAVLLACSEHQPDEFEIVGSTKTAVLDRLGKPYSEGRMRVRDYGRHIGPRPQVIKLLDGELEIWVYKVVNERAAAVYFRDHGRVVEVVIFRTDVVY